MGLAIVKDKIWPALGYVPTPPQRVIHADTARFQVNSMGRRTGKSTAGGHELVPEAYRAYFNRNRLEELGIRMEFWIVGPNYTDAEKEYRVFYNDCRRLKLPFDKPGTYYDSRSGNMQVSLWDGRFMLKGMSAAHPDALVGEGLFGVIMAEAAKQKMSVWDKYIRPTLSDFQGWGKFNSTPEGKNWFYEFWQRGQDPAEEEWSGHRFPSWMNTRIYPLGRQDPEILSLERGLTEEAFKQEIGADFAEYVGRVFKDWDEEIHVRDLRFRPDLPVYIATDYGWTNPNVALAIQTDVWDNVYILAEYYETGRTEQEFADDLKDHPVLGPLCRAARELYPDPEDPSASAVLARTLQLSIRGNTGGLRKHRINAIRKWLKTVNLHLEPGHPDRVPKLFVDRKCKNVIREMEAYRYPENRSEVKDNPEDPLKKDDHTPEALGRFFAGKYGNAGIGGPPRVRQSKVQRRRSTVGRR